MTEQAADTGPIVEVTGPRETQPEVTEAPAAAPVNVSPVTLLNFTYTHEAATDDLTASGSGAFSFFSGPGELTGNLQNTYSLGTLYQKIEVLSKPSSEPVQYQLCLVPNDDISVQPACTRASGLSFSEPGVYQFEQSISSLSQYDAIDWSKGISDLILVLKDKDGYPVDNRYFFSNDGTSLDMSLYYPMQVRYSAVLVPAGSQFAGWP